MSTARKRHAERHAQDSKKKRAKSKPRPPPRWLVQKKELDDIARRRCLLVLSVLSGETSVNDAVTQADVSRQTYFDMETRALEAMLAALTPASMESEAAGRTRLEELEQTVAQLERENRRAERLLLLTRRVVKPGTLKASPGRPPRKGSRPRSTTRGSKPSSGSPTTSETTTSSPEPSTPTTAGEDEH